MVNSILAEINWQTGDGTYWANACDFWGGDLSNALTSAENCGGKCASTSGCTHFSWTSYNGGTCWMKSGAVSKSDATSNSNNGMVCGILTNSGIEIF